MKILINSVKNITLRDANQVVKHTMYQILISFKGE